MSADPSARRGIPDATVARLPEYLRALTGLAERGITSRLLRGARGGRRGPLGQAAQGPVPPRAPTACAVSATRWTTSPTRSRASSASPRTGRWPSSAWATSGTRSPPTAGSRRVASGWSALLDQDPAMIGEEVAGLAGAAIDELRALVAEQRRRDRRHRHARRRRPGTSVTGWWPPASARILNFAPLRAVGARRRRRAQGRPVHRAADPGLPRAAQGVRRARRPRPVRVRADQVHGVVPDEPPVLGLSHHTLRSPLLEGVSLDGAARADARCAASRPRTNVAEAVVVATCNRTEVYAEGPPSTARSPTSPTLLADHAASTGRAARAPLRALRGPRRRARVHGGLRPGLHGGGGGAGPRPDARPPCAPARRRATPAAR